MDNRSFRLRCGLTFLLRTVLLWALHLVRVCAHSPEASTACTTSSTPTVSSLRARSRSPCRMKRPLVLLRPRGDVSSVVTGAPPGSLSARCVVFTVSPCLIIIPPFFPRPLTIDPAGRSCVAQVGRWYSGWYAACYAGGYSSLVRYFWTRALNWNAGSLPPLGETFDQTPLIVPIRGHLDSIKRLLKGDIYIGRGSRQRSLPKSRYCNTFKCVTGWEVSCDFEFSASVCSPIRLSTTPSGLYLERG